jgi:hypothetical protein|tara:strand:+ start:7134 stop:7364 length:231 start_codon:yes stop_codon:yes gene_type:complete
MEKKKKQLLFNRENYKAMIIGILFIILGFIIMSGGGSEDPNIFSDEIYSFRRIRLAPALILIGFVIQIYAILKSSK